jgi:hypothetical protein
MAQKIRRIVFVDFIEAHFWFQFFIILLSTVHYVVVYHVNLWN